MLHSLLMCMYNKHKYNFFILTEKDYMEQLTELTRLLFKLPEVKDILSKAQVEYLLIPEDPKKALVRFLEVFFIYCVIVQISYNYFSKKTLKCL